MSPPSVSITTVLFNSSSTVKRFAEPLRDQNLTGFAEVLAVDNASPDDSAARLKEALPNATVLTARRNLGFAGGCNLAWPSTRGRYWLLLNPDVESDIDGIQQLVQWMDSHPDVAIASPLLRDEGGALAIVARAFPSIAWTLAELLRFHKLISPRRRSDRLMGAYWDGEHRDVDWVPAAAIIVRREAIERVGPLSPELFMYGEDIEWCWRMRRSGWRVAICPDVEFVHVGGASANQTWEERERAQRLAAGIAGACRRMHGATWTRIYAGLTALGLFVEGIHPRRERRQRAQSRLAAGAWLDQAIGRAQ